MLILGVHTTSPHLGIAIVQGQQVLLEEVLAPRREHLENLAPLIRDALQKLNLGLQDFYGFGVAIGPGSFSGIRIGLATIKGICLALGKCCVGISSLDILAWQALNEKETGVAVIDARRNESYAAFYKKIGENLRLLDGPFLLSKRALAIHAGSINPKPVIIGEMGEIVEEWKEFEIRDATPSPTICALIAGKAFATGSNQKLDDLKPLYIRKSDAEEKRRVFLPHR